MSHDHYDVDQDQRWTCDRNPCLLHGVAREPGNLLLLERDRPSPLALADVLAAAVLDGVLPPFELERMAQRYVAVRTDSR